MKSIRYSGITAILLLCGICSGCGWKEGESNMGTMEDFYRTQFSRYLAEELDLAEYDEKLTSSDMRYLPNTEEEMSEAQKKDELGLTYIYLVNELYPDRLDEDECEWFTEAAKAGDVTEEDLNDMIQETFPRLITPREIRTEEDKKVETSYDYGFSPTFVTMDSLVFGIGTMSEFDSEGNYVDWEHEKEKMESLEIFAKDMEQQLAGKLGNVPIRVLVEN